MVPMSVFVPLNENADVRAATCNSLISASELSSSSVSPSEKYSCSLSPLMFTNGNTAIECGGGLKVEPAGDGAGAMALAAVPFTDAASRDGGACLEIQNLSTTM